MSEVTIEFRVIPPEWSLQSQHPIVVPTVTNVTELKDIVNGILGEGLPRDDWLFRAHGVRILDTLADAIEKIHKFNTETTMVVDVFLPLTVKHESTLETPDALVKIMSRKSQLICLGSRGNVSLFDKSDCEKAPVVLHSEEPNAVDLLPISEKDAEYEGIYWQITACGVVLRADIENETIDVEGKIDVTDRITAAAVRPDHSLMIIGDAEGNVFFYGTSDSKKRTAETSNRCSGAFNWTCVKPVISKPKLFTQPITQIDLKEDKDGYIAIISSLDGSIKVLDSLDGEVLNVFHTGSAVTSYARYEPNLILTGHIDGRCKVWHHASLAKNGGGQMDQRLVSQTHRRAVTAVALLTDRRGRDLLISSSNDRCVCVSDSDDGHVEQKYDLLAEASDKSLQIPNIGPIGDYGVFPTALLVDQDSLFVGTNNNRVHHIVFEK